MTVFIKRYPKKGELPSKEGLYHTNIGRVSFSKTFDWIDHHNYTRPCPNYWLEEIELPSDDDIYNKSTFYNDLESFEQGANYILNILMKK